MCAAPAQLQAHRQPGTQGASLPRNSHDLEPPQSTNTFKPISASTAGNSRNNRAIRDTTHSSCVWSRHPRGVRSRTASFLAVSAHVLREG